MENKSFNEVFTILKQHLFLIAFLGLTGLCVAAVYTFFSVSPTYSATTQMLVNHRSEENNSIQLEDINTNVQMINTYMDIIKGPVILEEVKKNMESDYSVGQLASMIAINANTNSQVFSLTITATNPTEASDIANEIAATFQMNIGEIMNVENVTVISKANPNFNPVTPNTPLNLLLGLLEGIMLGIGTSFIVTFMDTTLKNSQFVSQKIGWVDLGNISEIKQEEFTIINQFYELEPEKDRLGG